ncbi:phosphate metabolism protein 7 [Basidiobolus ranarum]|uniref:Phosphate metabolism protein 7 n=1 Tax=Basidiobolus ranarum TaxID=34480 RepID=A0ABR2X4Z5_9FUNG
MADDQQSEQFKNGYVAPFVTSLLFNLAVAGGFYVAYVIVHRLDDSIYEPRTYMVEKEKRPPKLPKSPIAWLVDVYKTRDKTLLKRIGFDSYVFLRFMRLCLVLFSIMTVLSIVIILPVNYTGEGTATGLNRFNIGNINPAKKKGSFWTHVIFDYIFTGLVLYFINRETSIYIKLRQRYLMSSEHQKDPVASTILVTGIPDELNNVEKLTNVFSLYPGGVKHVYINRDATKLQNDVAQRQTILEKLEQAQSNFIMASLKDPTKTPKRPTHRLGWIPFKGPKIDSIDYYKQELAQLNATILEQQKDPSKFPLKASAFITFHSQIAAHLAVQALAHHKPLVMEGRYLEVDPDEVIWENLNMFSLEKYIRKSIAVALAAGLVILWFFPVTFMSALFNIEELSRLIPPLKPILSWNVTIKGIITGVLPSLGMTILMSLLPIILALLSRYEGLVRDSDIQISVMNKYFFFLIVNVLLVTTLASGIFKVLHNMINNPSSIVKRLAESLPSASTFFMTYVMLNGISGGAKELLQAVPFVLRFVLTFLLPKTPRKLIRLKAMPCIQWGTFFPQHTLVFVIGIVYSTMAPLLLIFVTAYFLIFYFVYHHQFQYVYDSSKFQSGGLLYPRAVNHMFTGLYIYHLTMAGVVGLKEAYPQFILQLILALITVIAQMYGMRGFGPLIEYLPISVVEDPSIIGLMEEQKDQGACTDSPNDMSVYSDSSLINMQHLTRNHLSEKSHHSVAFENHANVYASSGYSTLGSSTRRSKLKAKLPPIYNQGPGSSFLHPALREPVPVVWLPHDILGIADKETYSLEKSGQPATTEGSSVSDNNRKINVSIWTAPSLLHSVHAIPEMPSQNPN